MSIVLNSAGICNPGCVRKRDSDDEDEISPKRARISYYVTLESESPLPTSEDDESIYTVQGNETEFVRDTSDTSTHSWNTSSDEDDDISVRLEFEVASHSEEENLMLNAASSSDPEDLVAMGVIAALYNDTDLAFADDSDDSRSTVDSEIGRADYWTCVQCMNKNNNPLFRYCEKCYQIRKNFFPPRPRRRKRRQQTEEEVPPVLKKVKLQEYLSSHDSGIGSQESKFSQDSDGNKSPEISQEIDTVDGSEPSIPVFPAKTEAKKIDTDLDSKCVTCTVSPKDGAFSHGSTLHVCCCYQCALKIWRKQMHCPICNRKIANVQKVFYN